MEDPLILREELAQLKKDIINLKHIKETMDNRIKEFHSEELRYLKEIPEYKRRSEYAKDNYLKLEAQSIPLKKELESIIKELSKVRGMVVEENRALKEIKEVCNSIEKECSIKKSEILKREEFIKSREESCKKTEYNQASRDIFHKKIESDLDNREVIILNKERALEHAHRNLQSALDIHNSNKLNHAENVSSLAEQRKFLEEDKQLLRDKLSKADKLIRDQVEIKNQLLLQADKASKAIKSAEDKQIILDKAIDELTHQENSLKIKDLKIRKMAHEAGLQKELKELEESLK